CQPRDPRVRANRRDCRWCPAASRTLRRASMLTPVTIYRHHLLVGSVPPPPSAHVAGRRRAGYRPPRREDTRPGYALARNLHEVGPAVVARPVRDGCTRSGRLQPSGTRVGAAEGDSCRAKKLVQTLGQRGAKRTASTVVPRAARQAFSPGQRLVPVAQVLEQAREETGPVVAYR